MDCLLKIAGGLSQESGVLPENLSTVIQDGLM